MTQHKQKSEGDKEALIAIVKEMTESFSGVQSVKHWDDDVLWFDIPPFASKGIKPAEKMYDKVFGGMKSCKIDILETEVFLSGEMAVVCTIQKVEVVFKDEKSKTIIARETDCFRKSAGEWTLFHQHASVPASGEWDGKITKD